VRKDQLNPGQHADGLSQLHCVELFHFHVLETGGTDVRTGFTTHVTPLEHDEPEATKDPLGVPQNSASSIHVLHEKQLAALRTVTHQSRLTIDEKNVAPKTKKKNV